MATIKQQKAIKNTVDNGGNVTKAMRDAGYSETTINNPDNLTKSKAWENMMDKFLTDDILVQKTLEGLESMKQLGARKIIRGAQGVHPIRAEASSETDDFIEVEDMPTRHKYLETALKMKGKLIDKSDITSDGEPILPSAKIIGAIKEIYGDKNV